MTVPINFWWNSDQFFGKTHFCSSKIGRIRAFWSLMTRVRFIFSPYNIWSILFLMTHVSWNIFIKKLIQNFQICHCHLIPSDPSIWAIVHCQDTIPYTFRSNMDTFLNCTHCLVPYTMFCPVLEDWNLQEQRYCGDTIEILWRYQGDILIGHPWHGVIQTRNLWDYLAVYNIHIYCK